MDNPILELGGGYRLDLLRGEVWQGSRVVSQIPQPTDFRSDNDWGSRESANLLRYHAQTGGVFRTIERAARLGDKRAAGIFAFKARALSGYPTLLQQLARIEVGPSPQVEVLLNLEPEEDPATMTSMKEIPLFYYQETIFVVHRNKLWLVSKR